MDPRIVQQQDGKAFGTTVAQVESGYALDPEYELGGLVPTRIGDTGLLKVFTLTPPEGSGLPAFFGRWDEKATSLDIDITGTCGDFERLFKQGHGGYGGHHPAQLAGDARRFQVEVRIPGRVVLRAVVAFGVERGVAIGHAVKLDVEFKAEVIRGEPGADKGGADAESGR